MTSTTLKIEFYKMIIDHTQKYKKSLAKNFQMIFRGVGVGGGGVPTLLQDLCSTGKNNTCKLLIV